MKVCMPRLCLQRSSLREKSINYAKVIADVKIEPLSNNLGADYCAQHSLVINVVHGMKQ